MLLCAHSLCPATTQATIVLPVFARSCSADGEVWFGKFLTPLSSIGEERIGERSDAGASRHLRLVNFCHRQI